MTEKISNFLAVLTLFSTFSFVPTIDGGEMQKRKLCQALYSSFLMLRRPFLFWKVLKNCVGKISYDNVRCVIFSTPLNTFFKFFETSIVAWLNIFSTHSNLLNCPLYFIDFSLIIHSVFIGQHESFSSHSFEWGGRIRKKNSFIIRLSERKKSDFLFSTAFTTLWLY